MFLKEERVAEWPDVVVEIVPVWGLKRERAKGMSGFAVEALK